MQTKPEIHVGMRVTFDPSIFRFATSRFATVIRKAKNHVPTNTQRWVVQRDGIATEDVIAEKWLIPIK